MVTNMEYVNWGIKDYNAKISGIYLRPSFDNKLCDSIIKSCSELPISETAVSNKVGDLVPNHSIRKSEIKWIPVDKEYEWIYRTCTDIINLANYEYFNYDLTFLEPMQFTKYDCDNAFFKKHIDASNDIVNGTVRKLSFSIQLSNSDDYSGGDLILYTSNDGDNAPRERGFATLFNSSILHEVTPVTSGTRYALVGWVNGPRWR